MRIDLVRTQAEARLRAWAAHGLPLAWTWTRYPEGTSWDLYAGCRRCESAWVGWVVSKTGCHRYHDSACGHIRALHGEMPPEVLALYELELLAGQP